MGEPEPNTGDYGEIKNCQFRSLDNATCITVKFEKVKRPALYIVKVCPSPFLSLSNLACRRRTEKTQILDKNSM